MSDASDLLIQLADSFASVIPDVDTGAEHDRWESGIRPFEEEPPRTLNR